MKPKPLLLVQAHEHVIANSAGVMGGTTADTMLKLGYPVSAWTRSPKEVRARGLRFAPDTNPPCITKQASVPSPSGQCVSRKCTNLTLHLLQKRGVLLYPSTCPGCCDDPPPFQPPMASLIHCRSRACAATTAGSSCGSLPQTWMCSSACCRSQTPHGELLTGCCRAGLQVALYVGFLPIELPLGWAHRQAAGQLDTNPVHWLHLLPCLLSTC